MKIEVTKNVVFGRAKASKVYKGDTKIVVPTSTLL